MATTNKQPEAMIAAFPAISLQKIAKKYHGSKKKR